MASPRSVVHPAGAGAGVDVDVDVDVDVGVDTVSGSAAGWAVGALAALLPMVFLPGSGAPFWAPKVALLLVAIGPGLVVLVRLGRRGDRPARLAMAFLAIASASTLASGAPLASLVGLYEVDGGLWFVAACLACWALGRTLGDEGRRWLTWGLVGATLFEALVAWGQMTITGSASVLAAFQGERASGTMGNPVFVGAFLAAGLWPLLSQASRASTRTRLGAWAAGAALVAGAVELSGSRVALAGVGLATAVHLRRFGPARAAVMVGALVLGTVLAGLATGPASGTDRVGSSGDGLRARVALWEMGGEALAERPLLGWGPGRFRAATSPRMRADVARAHGPDVVLTDGHDVAVEYAVTTGLLGLALGAAFVAAAARGARGPLAGFALVIGISWLVQPQGVDTTTVAFLALGAAVPAATARSVRSRGEPAPKRTPGLARRVAVGLGAIGVLLALALLVGDRALGEAERTGSLSAVRRAERWLAPWPVATATRAGILAEAARAGRPGALAEARTAAAAVARRDPSRSVWWRRLGDLHILAGDEAAAARAYREALRRNPWSAGALASQAMLARRTGDRTAEARLVARLCRVVPSADPSCATPRD